MQFEHELTRKYGAQYKEEPAFRNLVQEKLYLKSKSVAFSDHYHALMLDGLTHIYKTMLSQSETVKASESGFFSSFKTENAATLLLGDGNKHDGHDLQHLG